MTGWYAVDLDGTLAEHYWPEKGPFQADRIGDPVPVMVERVKGWLAEGIEVRIFTARVGPSEGHPVCTDGMPCGPFTPDDGRCQRCSRKNHSERARDAIVAWCYLHLGRALPVTATKDYGMRWLWDDRAVQVAPNKGTPAVLLTRDQLDALDWARAQARSAAHHARHTDAADALGRRAANLDELLAGAVLIEASDAA
jgi:hypothetical protein